MRYLFLILTFAFTTELEVDGNLKVTGTVDANGNAITNVGEPVLTSDVATANYVNTRTASKGRIITLKCGWTTGGGIGTCEIPSCPIDWIELITFNEVVGVGGWEQLYGSNTGNKNIIGGNVIRLCIEQEDSE